MSDVLDIEAAQSADETTMEADNGRDLAEPTEASKAI